MPLDGKQRRHLRSLAHHLDAIVQIGKLGLTDSVTQAINAALDRHELVKVRLGTECPDDRVEVAAKLTAALPADMVGTVGKTILFYRKSKKDPKITLPRASLDGGAAG